MELPCQILEAGILGGGGTMWGKKGLFHVLLSFPCSAGANREDLGPKKPRRSRGGSDRRTAAPSFNFYNTSTHIRVTIETPKNKHAAVITTEPAEAEAISFRLRLDRFQRRYHR